MARCQSAPSPSNHSRTDAAIVGPTPSVPASVSSSASRIAAIEPNSVASARAAVGPTWRIDSATSTRHSGTSPWPRRGWRAAAARWRRARGAVLALLGRAGEERRRQQGRLVEVEQVALVGDHARVEQRDGRLVAQALDVEGAATRDVEDPLAHLGRALLVVGAAEVLVALLLLRQGRRRTPGTSSASPTASGPSGRSASTGPRISGITSPALRRITVSPGRTSLRLTSWALCRVAFSTVEPATLVGSMTP